MTLAAMLSTAEDLLICDMAETYHILDIRALPVDTLAALASGLRDDSRIKMKMHGMEYVPMEVLAARCADTLALILYVLGADEYAVKPESLVDKIFGKTDVEKKESVGFTTGADFEAERRRLLGVIDDG